MSKKNTLVDPSLVAFITRQRDECRELEADIITQDETSKRQKQHWQDIGRLFDELRGDLIG